MKMVKERETNNKEKQGKHEMLRPGSFFKIIIDNTNQTSLSERNDCLNNGVNFRTNQVEDEDNDEATPKTSFDLADR